MTDSVPPPTDDGGETAARPPAYVFGAAGATSPLVAIAVDEAGRPYAASDAAAGRLEADGTVTPFPGLPMVRPRGLALAAAEAIVAVVEEEPAALHVLTPDGERLAGLGATELPDIERPTGVAIGRGRIAVCCPERDVVLRLDARTLAVVGAISAPEPVALAATASGLLLVASRRERAVFTYDAAGERIGALRGVSAGGAPALRGSLIAVPDPGAKGLLVGDFATRAFGWLHEAHLLSPAAAAFLPSGKLLVGQRIAPTLLRYDPTPVPAAAV